MKMYKYVFCMALGLIIGIRLTDLWDYMKYQSDFKTSNTKQGGGLINKISSTKLNDVNDDDHVVDGGDDDDDLLLPTNRVARHLYNNTRVLCWVLTTPANHLKRALHLQNTWGKRCNKLLFMSTAEDPGLENVVKLPVTEGRGFLWRKTREALLYIYKQHYNDADWFLKVDDDTYVIMENLRLFLYPFDTKAPVYFGCKFNPFVRQGYMSGGAGYVLSREALRRFAVNGYHNTRLCSNNTLSEDKELGVCLQNVGIVAGDSRDKLGRERFLPLAPKHLIPESTSEWFAKYLFYKRDKSAFCCSHSAISFHYTKPHEFYIYDYFLYALRPFGLSNESPASIPSRLSSSSMESLLNKWRKELSDNIYAD